MFQQIFTDFSSQLDKILTPEVQDLLNRISIQPGSQHSPFVTLPGVLNGMDEALSKVAETSNQYAKATRLAGLVRAQYKMAEATFKYKFRTSIGAGKNSAEREAKAYAQSEDEYNNMILLESIVELCESIESAARIASESARRMMLGIEQTFKADNRTERAIESGFKAEDFTVI